MRYLKSFTFYPGEWSPARDARSRTEQCFPTVADGTLQVNLCVGALWDALELPGDTGCDLIEESKYDIADGAIEELDDRIAGLEDEIGALETQIEELEDENKEIDTLCARLEDENETLKEQIATLLEKLNGR